VTVYFDKRAFEQQEKEEQEELEEKQKQEAAIKAVGQLVAFFTKPLVLMLLWNWLVPGIFGLATIGYLKAFGLFMISRIIFDKND
tara:strand:- start:38 stop:292 length:255 start_codon:yes stop_codon:yes gene_type:complete